MFTRVNILKVENTYEHFDNDEDEWGDPRLEEVYQNSKDRMAFGMFHKSLNHLEIVTPFFKCRDFFNDIIVWNLHNLFESENIYGLTPSDFTLELDKVSLVIENNAYVDSESFYKKLKSVVKEFEFRIDLISDIKEKYLIINFPRKVINNQIIFSFFTLLVRKAYLLESNAYSEYDFLYGNLNGPDRSAWEYVKLNLDMVNRLINKAIEAEDGIQISHNTGISMYMEAYGYNL